MAKTKPTFISFHSDGTPSGLGASGDYLFSFGSELLLRYRLIDGVVVDLYEGLTDEEALAKVLVENETRAAEIAAKVAAELAAKPYELYKTDVIAAMSDEELDAFDEQLAASSTRERRMWTDCTRLVSTEPYFGALLAGFQNAFGKERGAQLLARR